jgi:hypothetical protein
MSRDDGVLLPPDVVTAWSDNEQVLESGFVLRFDENHRRVTRITARFDFGV